MLIILLLLVSVPVDTSVDISVDTSVDTIVDISSMTEQQNPSMQSLWQDALQSIEQRMSSRMFELWIEPLELLSLDEDQLTLLAPNSYLKEWFEDNYLQSLRKELQQRAGRPIAVQIRLGASGEPEPDSPATPTAAPVLSFSEPPEHATATADSGPAEANPPASDPARSHLYDRYRFENFVVGPSNQFARAAAELVAEKPGVKYNPLFIYGGTGLGKTHLLQAVGHALLDRHPGWNVTYVTSERFTNEYISSVRQKKMEEFRRRYRDECDALLVDDVQFLAGKENTEQEFFHTFNSLHERKRQIVITSDKMASEMPELQDRLKSRFQWGLIVDIQAPELETRVAILRNKAALDGISLSDDVSTFLATHIRSNVRELEGALIRLAAFSSLQGRAITVEFAEKILSNMLQRGRGKLSIERIQREVAGYFNIRIKDLKSHRRPRAISYPRQIAMYLCRKHTTASLSEIGRHFGGKDHTTVLSADKKIRQLLEQDDETQAAVESVERLLGL